MSRTNGGAHTYVRPVVVPCERTSLVRPHIVRDNRLVWLPINGGGRKRARLPRAV